MEGLGGENSSRLLLGGLLADLCAEHYTWLATGDKNTPEAATVQARAATFLSRLGALFIDGAILGMPETYTGVTLRFLKGASRYPCGNGVQIVGLGDLSQEAVTATCKAALRRAQRIVANAKENMKLYRPEHSWLHAFTAFRLPSPLSATGAGAAQAATAAAEAEACLKRICREASLSEQKGIVELRRLLKRAQQWHQQGCTTRQAWGRAAAEWPELNTGRRLVELFLVWKTSSGNVERRFRRFAEVHCPERARLLDTTVEECALVDQAPPSKLLRTWLQQQERTVPAAAATAGADPHSTARRWYRRVLLLHERLHASKAERIPRVERRDKGITREPRPDSRTEAGFGRKRAAAIDAIMATSPSKRPRILAEAAPDFAALAQGAAAAATVGPAATVVANVAKREAQARERYLGGAKAAAKARCALEKKVLRSATPGPAGRDADLVSARLPGLMLARMGDAEARRKAQRLKFKLVHDPVDFVAQLVKENRKIARKKANVVLAAKADARTDYGICAQIAAAFTGAFFTTPTDFAQQSEPQGTQYAEKLRSSTTICHVAATADLQAELPTLPQLLRTLAQAPGGCVKFHRTPRKLCKFFQKIAKLKKRMPRQLQRICVLSCPGEEKDAEKKCKELYSSPQNWVRRFDASVEVLRLD